MTERFPQFLIDLKGKSPRNLKDSIRYVQNASAGFIRSWKSKELQDAEDTSQDAFEHLDFIQNEILRQRDVHRKISDTWQKTPFNEALSLTVGSLHENITPAERNWFKGLPQGEGAMPKGVTPCSLTLEKALNKLKHRDTVEINFSLSDSGIHTLFIITNAGAKQPDSISEIKVNVFCDACKSAAQHI